jgi:hypothetical protein
MEVRPLSESSTGSGLVLVVVEVAAEERQLLVPRGGRGLADRLEGAVVDLCLVAGRQTWVVRVVGDNDRVSADAGVDGWDRAGDLVLRAGNRAGQRRRGMIEGRLS